MVDKDRKREKKTTTKRPNHLNCSENNKRNIEHDHVQHNF